MAARRLGEDEAYWTVRDILSEASTVSDGALSRERSAFYRCGFVTLGFSCRGGTGTLRHRASLFSHIGSRKTNPSHLSISSRDLRPVKFASYFGVLEFMKSQTPSTKLQINLKFQYSMTKTRNRFGISNFGHCDLFDI